MFSNKNSIPPLLGFANPHKKLDKKNKIALMKSIRLLNIEIYFICRFEVGDPSKYHYHEASSGEVFIYTLMFDPCWLNDNLKVTILSEIIKGCRAINYPLFYILASHFLSLIFDGRYGGAGS